jgi:hypothetical protein
MSRPTTWAAVISLSRSEAGFTRSTFASPSQIHSPSDDESMMASCSRVSSS